MRRTLLALALALASCTTDTPKGVITQGKMERILYDYHLAQGIADGQRQGLASDRQVLVAQVFAKYGITEAQFDSSMVWYSAHSERLAAIYQHLDQRLTREANKLGADTYDDVYAHLSDYGDTAIVWQAPNLCLHNTPADNILSFTIHPDSTFKPGDTYALRMRNRFVVQDGSPQGYAMLIARYKESPTPASAVTRIAGDFDASLQLPRSLLADTATLTQLEAVFYFPYDSLSATQFRLWLVVKPMLLRMRQPGVSQDASSEAGQAQDTLSAVSDTLSADTPSATRLTPQQMRERHEGERTINVTRQRRVTLPPRRGGNRQRR